MTRTGQLFGLLVLGSAVGVLACAAPASSPAAPGTSVSVRQSALTTNVTVTVLDANGVPQTGSDVYAQVPDGDIANSAEVDANGHAVIALGSGSYQFYVPGTPGFEFMSSTCVVPSCITASITVQTPVQITVLDGWGNPLAGVDVVAIDENGNQDDFGQSDDSGQLPLSVDPATYQFDADYGGTDFESDPCTVPGCTSATIQIQKPVQVTVADGYGGALANIHLAAVDNDGNEVAWAYTDDTGQATMYIPPGAYFIQAEADDGTDFDSGPSGSCPIPGCTAASITITDVMVTVTDTSGNPVTGQRVTATASDGTEVDWPTTDDQGHADAFVWPGAYVFSVQVNGNGYDSAVDGNCVVPGCRAALITIPALAPSLALDDLGSLGGGGTFAAAVNSQDTVVGQSTTAAGATHAFTWNGAGPLADTGSAPGFPANSMATGISDTGVMTGSLPQPDQSSHVFTYSPVYGFADLGVGGDNSVANDVFPVQGAYGYGINNSGQVAGIMTNGGAIQGFRYTPGVGFLSIGTLGGAWSWANAIAASGMVVGSSQLPGSPTGGYARLGDAVSYTDGAGLVDLNSYVDPSTGLTLIAANAVAGTFIVGGGQSGGPIVPFRLNTSTGFAEQLEGAWNGDTVAYGVNTAGDTVGFGYLDSADSEQAAFVFTDQIGFQNLNDLVDPTSGWNLQAATGIDASDDVVGWGYHNGQLSAFHLRLSPKAIACQPSGAQPCLWSDGVVDQGNGTFVALFGYSNSNSTTITPTTSQVLIDGSAVTSPNPAPPTQLFPGSHPGAFLPSFGPGQTVTWTVNGQSVSVAANSRVMPSTAVVIPSVVGIATDGATTKVVFDYSATASASIPYEEAQNGLSDENGFIAVPSQTPPTAFTASSHAPFVATLAGSQLTWTVQGSSVTAYPSSNQLPVQTLSNGSVVATLFDGTSVTLDSPPAPSTISGSGAFMPFGGQDVECVAVVGTQLQSATCGGSGQTFVINGSTIQTNTSPPLCLGIQNQDLVAGVATVTACDGSASQQWSFNGSEIVSMNMNDGNFHCLDVQGGSRVYGTPIDVAVCNNTDAQSFWAAGFTMTIASTFSASGTPECLSVLNDNEAIGASLADSVCNGSNAQTFVLTTALQITLANNPSLCVSRGIAQLGLASVFLSSCNSNDPAQKCYFSNQGQSGQPVVTIECGKGGCLDIQDGSQASPTTVDINNCTQAAGQLWQPILAASAPSPWTKVAMPFPGGIPGPTNVALMTDGTVLASISNSAWIPSNVPYTLRNDQSNYWYLLTPDSQGSYANGTWSLAPSSNLGRSANQSFVLNDGRYLECGGEYMDDRYELAMHDPTDNSWSRCEIYDPIKSLNWTESAPFPDFMRDVPAVELGDGKVMALQWSQFGNDTEIFDPVANQWKQDTGFYTDRPVSKESCSNEQGQTPGINNEGDCVLQQDGRVFCGIDLFSWFVPPASPSPYNQDWIDGAPVGTNGPAAQKTYVNCPFGSDESGPMLLLQDGSVMVLGSNTADPNWKTDGSAQSAIFRQPDSANPNGHWDLAADMPPSMENFDHGDVPSAVMPDGRVLVTSRQFAGNIRGQSPEADVLHEYDPSVNPPFGAWTLVPPFPVSPGSDPILLQSEGMRMLTLPNGQVLVTGTSDGSMWLYNSSGTPNASWLPTIKSITPSNDPEYPGTYTLTGTQLNGLTNGANYGDDAKMTTSYPIVFLTNRSGSSNVYYARTFKFSSMTPAPSSAQTSQPPTCEFALPPGIPSGDYTVHVSASGAQSDPTPTPTNLLTVSGIHVSSVTVDPTNPLMGTVSLSDAAPAGGLQVTLVSETPTLTVQSSVTIPARATSAPFSATLATFGGGVVDVDTSPSNPSFPPLKVQMGWTIQSITNPSGVYGDRGALTTQPWTITFSPSTAPIPANATVSVTAASFNYISSDLDVATIAGQQVSSPNSITVNVAKTGLVRGFAKISASAGNTSLSYTFSDRDVDFYKCADEGGYCATDPSSPRWIAYGANGYYNYLLTSTAPSSFPATTASVIPCNASVFGNPSGATNACYVSSYVLLTNPDGTPVGSTEPDGSPAGSSFTLNSPVDVAYGGYTGYSYNQSGPLAGTHSCNGGIFGSFTDPSPGSLCFAGPDPRAYTYQGGPGQQLTVPPSTPIAYGAAGHFLFSLANGNVTCGAGAPDPAPAYTDECYTLSATRFVSDEGQSLFLPPGSTVRYGSGLNGNFLLGTTGAFPACTDASFGGGDSTQGDPDPGEPKHCWIQSTPARTFQEADTQDIYVLDTSANLWLEQAPFGQASRELVDITATTFQAIDSQNVFVLGRDGNLWFEHAPFGGLPPRRDHVDTTVLAFQALDSQLVLVLGVDQNLWLEHAPFGSLPPKRVQIGASVQAFSKIDDATVLVVKTDGTLVLAKSPFVDVNDNVLPGQQLDTGVVAAEALDAEDIYELKTDGTLWNLLAGFQTGTYQAPEEVDSTVAGFFALEDAASDVVVLDQSGNLWLEQAPFGEGVPPIGRQLIDVQVAAFEPIDAQHILVLKTGNNLYLDVGPSFPYTLQAVDSSVAPFNELGQ